MYEREKYELSLREVELKCSGLQLKLTPDVMTCRKDSQYEKLINSAKKRNVLSLSTAFIFSKLNMCKYLYEHYKI